MATPIVIKGKKTRRPGVYTQIKSGVKNQPAALDYGNVLIIDTIGLTQDWAAGSGITGEFKENRDAFYSFDNVDDFRDHVKGGYLWYLSNLLFNPRKRAIGASTVTIIKPATTTAASIEFTNLANGNLTIDVLDEGTGANGTLSSGNLSKGYAAKMLAGVVDANKVYFQFYVGTYRGQDTFNTGKHFGGIAPESAEPDLLVESPEFSTLQEFVDWATTDNSFKSKFVLNNNYAISDAEVTSVTAVADVADSLNGKYFTLNTPTVGYYVWYKTSGGALSDPAVVGRTGIQVNITTGDVATAVATATAAILDAHAAFTVPVPGSAIFIVSNAVAGTVVNGAVGTSGFTISVTEEGGSTFIAADLITYTGYTLATGGTEVFNPADLAKVFEYANKVDWYFCLSTHNAANAQASENSQIVSFLESADAKYERQLFIGGGYNKSAFNITDTNSSQEIADFFDSDAVVVVHGGEKVNVTNSVTPNVYDSLYKTFKVVGRIAGLTPQTSATLKTMDIDGEIHLLSDKEQEAALDYGVLYTYYDNELESFVIGQGVTTIQNNDNIVNEDGTTFSIAVRRISSQLNREILVNAKRTFYGTDSGPNRITISEESVKSFLDGYLNKKVATSSDDNIILRYDRDDIVVSTVGDVFQVSYSFVPNFEVNKMIVTGFILEK